VYVEKLQLPALTTFLLTASLFTIRPTWTWRDPCINRFQRNWKCHWNHGQS